MGAAMKAFRRALIASLSVAVLGIGVAHAASTTNFSDQWWVPTESGWGAAVLQQASTLFVNLMVYGADGKPTWFVAASSLQDNSTAGHSVFLGDLYATSGPYYGGAFNPVLVSERKVGTLKFDATSASDATVSYTVDGTPVVKNVTRQTWSYEDLSASYQGGWNADRSNCINGPANETHFEDPLTITITKNADNAVTVNLRFGDGGAESFRGTYAQSGHLGRIDGEFPDGLGWIAVSEIETTRSGCTGRFEGDLVTSRWRDWCEMKNGRIGGVRR
jgi:hypothetical protein